MPHLLSGRAARVAGGFAVVAAVMVPVSLAQADTAPVGVAVTGAPAVTLASPTFSDFGAVVLNGAAQDTTSTVGDWVVNDATGTAAGWSINVAADAPHNAGATVTMAGAAMVLDAPVATATDITNTAAAPVVAGGDLLGGGGVNAADAADGTGQGQWNLAQPANSLTLTVPANALADSYTSTITTTVNPAV
jgi:WxL domain surface cell wall-binding